MTIRPAALFMAAAVLALVLIVACNGEQRSRAGVVSSGGTTPIGSAGQLQPDASPGEKAVLRLAGTRIPVEIKRVTNGTEVVLELWRHGEIFEREIYERTETAFSLVEAAEQRFAKPLPLVRHEAAIGDSWEWDGTITFAGLTKPASATISTATDNVGEARIKTIRSDVLLKIQADPGLPAVERKLSFWFAEGKGVVKREFGESFSLREPAEG